LFPYRCDKLETQLEIKNSKGEIVGVLINKDLNVLFRQAKTPYSTTGYEIAEDESQIKLTFSGTETIISAGDRSNNELGNLKIVGTNEITKKYQSYYNRPPAEITNGKNWVSDCNGLVQESSLPLAGPQTISSYPRRLSIELRPNLALNFYYNQR
jgi:hypothetical protein